MDWLSWLSKTNLDPSLVYDYALTFAHNELDQEDIPFFNHEFLQSMGISVAKHRLEILKLVRKDHQNKGISKTSKQKILWLVFLAVKRVRKNLVHNVRGLIGPRRRPEDNNSRGGGQLAVVSARNCSLRWKAAMLKRNKSQEMPRINITKVNNGQGRLMMLTHGSPLLVDHYDAWANNNNNNNATSSGSSSPVEEDEKAAAAAGDGGEYWSPTVEDIKWDSMFQNLKPT